MQYFSFISLDHLPVLEKGDNCVSNDPTNAVIKIAIMKVNISLRVRIFAN